MVFTLRFGNLLSSNQIPVGCPKDEQLALYLWALEFLQKEDNNYKKQTNNE